MSEGKARSWVSYPGGLGFGGSSPHAQPLCDGLWLRMKWAGPAAPGRGGSWGGDGVSSGKLFLPACRQLALKPRLRQSHDDCKTPAGIPSAKTAYGSPLCPQRQCHAPEPVLPTQTGDHLCPGNLSSLQDRGEDKCFIAALDYINTPPCMVLAQDKPYHSAWCLAKQ